MFLLNFRIAARFADNLQMNPANPGMQFHTLDKAGMTGRRSDLGRGRGRMRG